jgi:hypothetical protein
VGVASTRCRARKENSGSRRAPQPLCVPKCCASVKGKCLRAHSLQTCEAVHAACFGRAKRERGRRIFALTSLLHMNTGRRTNGCGPECAAGCRHISWGLGEDDAAATVEYARQANGECMEPWSSGAYLSSCASGLAVAPEGEVAGRRLGGFLVSSSPQAR